MNPLIVNTFDHGGAANSAIRLHLGLQDLGVNSNFLLKYKTKSILKSYQFEQRSINERYLLDKIFSYTSEFKKRNNQNKIKLYQRTRDTRLEYFSSPYSESRINQFLQINNHDLINLHWVSDFIDWNTFFENISQPIVWTLHDQNPFLGGEHYDEKYIGIDNYGNPIKRKYTQFELDLEKRLIEFKYECTKRLKRVHVVSPSNWLMEESKKSLILGRFEHSYIRYGYPDEFFKLREKLECREFLKIPKNKKIILFVADSIKNERKGIKYLIGALNKMNKSIKKEILCCIVGNRGNFVIDSNIPIIEFGYIKDEDTMSAIYSAADLFVLPSLIDNSPNTVIESLLCGTPVVAFNVGGVPDLIQNGKNGYLSPKISVDELKRTIENYIFGGVEVSNFEISEAAKKKYSLKIQAESYKDLYKRILIND
jgi:glycosyltransferase involved in cell wall biosynthesis